MRSYPVLFLVTFALWFTSAAKANSDTPASLGTIIFTCSIDPTHPVFAIADALFKSAFAALNYNFRMVNRPSKRALAEASSGRVDGECARYDFSGDAEGLNESLVRVDAQLLKVTNYAWTYNPSLHNLRRNELANGPYVIGYVRGHLIATHALANRDSDLNIATTDIEQGLRMLFANRLDIFLGPQALVQYAATSLGLNSQPEIAGELGRYAVYPYLSMKYQDLAGPLAKELNKALQDPQHPLHQYDD